MTAFVPGMRVVIADGDWPLTRIAGHYGKVTDVILWRPEVSTDDPPIRVEITGHIDGQPPDDLSEIEWYWPEELAVVD